MRPRSLLLGLALALTVAGSGLGASAYSVSVSPAVETPDREVQFQGQSFEITHMGRVDPGDSLSVTVGAPSGDAYDVYLYDADRNILDRHRDPDSSAVSFDVPADDPNYPSGTYVVAVDHDGTFRTVAPVVVSGYRVDVDVPASADRGSTVTVEASLTTVDDSEPIDRVQVVIGNDDDERRETLSSVGGGDYRGSFALDSLPAGDYSLYVVVQGADSVLGRQEVLGVSDSRSFELTGGSTTTSAPSEDGGDGGGGGGATSPSSPTTAGPASTTASPSTTAGEGTTEVVTTGGGEPTADDPTTDANARSPTTDGAVITPNDPTTAARATTTPGQTLGVLPALVALALAALLAGRRR